MPDEALRIGHSEYGWYVTTNGFQYLHRDGVIRKGCGLSGFFETEAEAQAAIDRFRLTQIIAERDSLREQLKGVALLSHTRGEWALSLMDENEALRVRIARAKKLLDAYTVFGNREFREIQELLQ